jgi:hypothetical protein
MSERIQYLVTETDTFVDLERALNDKSWARLFGNLAQAEDYAKKNSLDELVGIHKFVMGRYEGLLVIAWDEEFFRKDEQS